jgi:hypothetical protein
MNNNSITDTQQNSRFILYQDDNGITSVNVRFDSKDVWFSQPQIAMLFETTRENIVQHIRNIYQEDELQEERTCKDFLQVQTDGSRFEEYRHREILQYESDFDRAVKELTKQAKNKNNEQ